MIQVMPLFLEAQQQGGLLPLLGTFGPLVLLFGVMYFLMIRPQKKREKELKNQVAAMQVGDHVVTIGGIIGRVMNLSDDEVTISTSVANTMLTFRKSAIGSIQKASSIEE